ncbi:6-phosphofructokinase [Trichlorobacter sp.]|uniref:6-phosphofructokinase n=1 Tax=Trichlorobacter sp. TaxID=2911007 RepID=UPI002A35CB13|nr:6-phosphofructokinase [Trichlorobacter sp.]MDY0383533.1 6-phosphofructokinase [Trichlorobacter sp.]
MKRLAILTSGGDCSGMNATIRAAARTAISQNVEMIGYRKGYAGLVKNDFIPLDTMAVAGILQRGGTFLQSARSQEFRTEEGRKKALDNLMREGVEGLIVVGGDGSLTGALALDRMGFPVIGIPASIDNDIPFTDMSLGVDTALNNIIYAVDCIKDTASSHDRAFIVEVMGRGSGYLASTAAVATGAEFAIVPEIEFDLSEMCGHLRQRHQEGRNNAIILMAEGAGQAHELAAGIKDTIGFEVRVTVLGHYQRGGSPTVFDRLLGSRYGKRAVELLLSGTKGVMVGLSCHAMVTTLLEAVIKGEKRPQDEILKMAEVLGI